MAAKTPRPTNDEDFALARSRMVTTLARRGITDPDVLEAFQRVPREKFIDARLREFAYADHPLPIAEDQTISQPYMVALMAQALEIEPEDRVLEVGTGSGYAAAILGQLASQVYTIERYESLASVARERLEALGYRNVHVAHGDGTMGWKEAAPFDKIVVAAGGPEVPPKLKEQLKIGGRLLIPVGDLRDQELVLVVRTGHSSYERSSLGAVRFVPLVGVQGWAPPQSASRARGLRELIRDQAETFDSIAAFSPERWLERVGDARVVLLGESSHGTSEFYRMRARMTKDLIEHKGFNLVAVEADWPDARYLDNFIQLRTDNLSEWSRHARFPHWMWRNQEMMELVYWLRAHNQSSPSGAPRVGFYGLDLYSMQASIHGVLEYLDENYPSVAELARHRYSCLTPWQYDPAAYGQAVLTRAYRQCEPIVVQHLLEELGRRAHPQLNGKGAYLDALVNSKVVSHAEEYYRVMYYGAAESWNLRDQHMFEVLETLLESNPQARAIVWAHNSHLGDARATEMSTRGEQNLGQLARQRWEDRVYSVGFGTHTGTVAAASRWGAEMETKTIRASHERSFERLFHETGLPHFTLPLRSASEELRQHLSLPRLERAIGVIYRPETELASHYFHADLSRQFDEFVWFDATTAVRPLSTTWQSGPPEMYPSGI